MKRTQVHRVWYLVCHMRHCVTYPVLRRMLGYIDDHQLHE